MKRAHQARACHDKCRAKMNRPQQRTSQRSKLLHGCSFCSATIAAEPVSGYNSQPNPSASQYSFGEQALVGNTKDGQLPIFFFVETF
jgi:hypothetical protein